MALVRANYHRLYRTLDRLSGDPDLAADLAQEAHARLFRRGALPDHPEAWLVTVALNLLRNTRGTERRRRRLLGGLQGERPQSDPGPPPDQAALAADTRRAVRSALGQLSERDAELLLLRAEGYSYRELAQALDLHEPSIGTQLARARRAFREAYGEDAGAP